MRGDDLTDSRVSLIMETKPTYFIRGSAKPTLPPWKQILASFVCDQTQ